MRVEEPFGLAGLVLPDGDALAVVRAGKALPLSELGGMPTSFDELFEDWDGWVDRIQSVLSGAKTSDWKPLDEFGFGVPGVERPALYCAGGNYHDHLQEMGASDVGRVFHFVSPPAVLSSHGATVTPPSGVEKLDWEAELAAVIGRPARNVGREEALSYVAGYAVANDLSVRGPEIFHPIFGVDWMYAKNGDGMTALGPAIVPARFIEDPQQLHISLSVNGVSRQNSNTSQMIAGVAEQLAVLSASVTLQPGDIILTGTPAGTGTAHGVFLNPGDVVTASIELLGDLVTHID